MVTEYPTTAANDSFMQNATIKASEVVILKEGEKGHISIAFRL